MFLCQWCCQASLTSGQEQEKKPMQRPIYVSAAFICMMSGEKMFKNVQGDPNRNFLFQMAVPLKLSISDPMLVKPKCVWEVCASIIVHLPPFVKKW